MVMDMCLDCGLIRQNPGSLRYCCSKCDRFTYHLILPRCFGDDKDSRNLENFYAGGLK